MNTQSELIRTSARVFLRNLTIVEAVILYKSNELVFIHLTALAENVSDNFRASNSEISFNVTLTDCQNGWCRGSPGASDCA